MPIFDANHDFSAAFEKGQEYPENPETHDMDSFSKNKLNRHGVPVLDNRSEETADFSMEEDFAQLLEISFKEKSTPALTKSSPMPVKKRIKRYPPVEVELDLHGFTAIGAQVKAQSFIHSCKNQGYFTLRIIVGKGLHSDLGPVLPDVVEDVLQEMKKQNLVIFYEWDKKKKSKSGAVIVYLKHFEAFE